MLSLKMTHSESLSHPVTGQIQKVLDENAQLILTIQEFQRKGRHQDSIKYQQFLRRNLICLSSVAGLDTNLDVLLPPPITDMYSSVRFNNNLHKDRQRKRQNMQQKGKYKQQSQSRLMYTQEAGQMKNGSYYRPSTPSIRPSSQQNIPLLQYQGQLRNTNFATTNNSLVGYNQSGYVRHPSNQFSRAEDPPVLVISSNYLNPNYINLTNPSYQSNALNIPYNNQPSSRYSQNSTVSLSRNFSNNYFPVGYIQQPVNSSSQYGQVTNQISYTNSGYTPQITYTTTQTVQSPTISSSGYFQEANQKSPRTSSKYDQITNQMYSYTNSEYSPHIEYSTSYTTHLQKPIGECASQIIHKTPSIQSETYNTERVQVPNQMSYTSSDYDLQMAHASCQTTRSASSTSKNFYP